jgi:hypothetical protein
MAEFDNLIGRVEDFLKKSKPERVGFVTNPYKISENGVNPLDLAGQLQGGIYNALKSDFAETLETLDWYKDRPFVSDKFLRRHIYLKWDGKLPSEDNFTDDKDTGEPSITNKTYPYRLSLSVLGYSKNIAKLRSMRDGGEVALPDWPDRARFRIFHVPHGEKTSMDIIIDNPHDKGTSGSAALGWFEDLKDKPNPEEDPDYRAYQIMRRSSGIDRIGTLYRDYYMMRNILMFGMLDIESITRAQEYLINSFSAQMIRDPESTELTSTFLSAVMDKLFPEIETTVKQAYEHQQEFNS